MTEQKILDNAPAGATHFIRQALSTVYFKSDTHLIPLHWCNHKKGWRASQFFEFNGLRSLSDIKRIAELKAQLQVSQPEWISVEEFKPNGQRMFDVWYGNHRLSGIQLLDGDYWDTVSARYLDSSAITHCIMPPAPPEKG